MVLAFCGLELTYIAQICFSFMWFSQITRVVFPPIECDSTEGWHPFYWAFHTDPERRGEYKTLLENFDVCLYRTEALRIKNDGRRHFQIPS